MAVRAPRHDPYRKVVRPQSKVRESASKRGYDFRWRKERLKWLALHPLCEVCRKTGRVTAADEIDHITPHNGDMALFWDTGNWQSICRPCHESKSAGEGSSASVTPRWLPSPSKPLTVVCGPPCAGKTTYVSEHAGARDLVLDLDVMAEEQGRPLHDMSEAERQRCIRLRNRRLADFCEGRTAHPRCWLIATAGSFKQRKFWLDLGADVVVVNPGAAVCKQRVREDQTRPKWTVEGRLAAVDRWH